MKNFSPKKITLSGTPEQMGNQHGETLRPEIRQLFDERMAIISQLTNASAETVEKICQEVLDCTQEVLPNISQELMATSLGANIEPWKLVVAGGFSDVLDRCGKASGKKVVTNECSLITTKLSDGRPILAGTWDTHATAQKSLILVERQANVGPSCVALSTAGWPMQQGLNELGLGFAISNMAARTVTHGTSYICALGALANEKSAKDAAELATKIPLCSARYYTFVDPSGSSFGVENDGKKSYELSGYTAHTNHFVSEQGAKVEGRPEGILESESRRCLMEEQFTPKLESIEDVFEVLSFSDIKTFSIMKLGEGWSDRTCAAFAISPLDRTIWYTSGPPKYGEISKISLKTNSNER